MPRTDERAAEPGTPAPAPAAPVPHTGGAPWRAALFGAIVAGLAWLPAVLVPFWQDDYENLILSRDAMARGEPWWTSFIPLRGAIFWRPLSAGLYWRTVTGVFHGSAVAAHLLNLLVLVLSAWAVGWLAATLVMRASPSRRVPEGAAFAAAFLFGIHASRLVPVAWACAIQESMGTAFAAFALLAWTDAITTERARGVILFPFLFAAALLSKESAAATPAIAAVIAWWLRRDLRPSRRMAALGVLTLAIMLAWFAIRRQFLVLPQADSPYALELGANVARNGGSLLLFALGAPREAFRFVIEAHSWIAAAWGAACLALGATGVVLMFRSASARLDRRARVALLFILGIALAPYLALRWNCYEYYLSLALLAWAVIVAGGDPRERRFRWGFVTSVLAAVLAAAVVFVLPSPAVIGRARTVERDLVTIAGALHGVDGATRIAYRADDARRSRAMGDANGIAFRLHVPVENVQPVAVAGADSAARPLVIIAPDGIRVER